MENVNLKELMENAIQYVKGVYEEHIHLLDFHPNFIKELDMLDPAAADAPTKLKKVINDANQLKEVLDLTSLPLMKIWDYFGSGLLVLKGDKCFAIVYDLKPTTSDCVLKVYKIHDKMFLCITSTQVEADFFFQLALQLDKVHLSDHQKHMSPEGMSHKLGKYIHDHLRSIESQQVIAGFSDDNEVCIYAIDQAGYVHHMSDFAVLGRRASDLMKQCMILRENKLDQDKLCDKAVRVTLAALTDPASRLFFRAHMYTVTPDMIEEKRLEGKGKLPAFYLRY